MRWCLYMCPTGQSFHTLASNFVDVPVYHKYAHTQLSQILHILQVISGFTHVTYTVQELLTHCILFVKVAIITCA